MAGPEDDDDKYNIRPSLLSNSVFRQPTGTTPPSQAATTPQPKPDPRGPSPDAWTVVSRDASEQTQSPTGFDRTWILHLMRNVSRSLAQRTGRLVSRLVSRLFCRLVCRLFSFIKSQLGTMRLTSTWTIVGIAVLTILVPFGFRSAVSLISPSSSSSSTSPSIPNVEPPSARSSQRKNGSFPTEQRFLLAGDPNPLVHSIAAQIPDLHQLYIQICIPYSSSSFPSSSSSSYRHQNQQQQKNKEKKKKKHFKAQHEFCSSINTASTSLKAAEMEIHGLQQMQGLNDEFYSDMWQLSARASKTMARLGLSRVHEVVVKAGGLDFVGEGFNSVDDLDYQVGQAESSLLSYLISLVDPVPPLAQDSKHGKSSLPTFPTVRHLLSTLIWTGFSAQQKRDRVSTQAAINSACHSAQAILNKIRDKHTKHMRRSKTYQGHLKKSASHCHNAMNNLFTASRVLQAVSGDASFTMDSTGGSSNNKKKKNGDRDWDRRGQVMRSAKATVSLLNEIVSDTRNAVVAEARTAGLDSVMAADLMQLVDFTWDLGTGDFGSPSTDISIGTVPSYVLMLQTLGIASQAWACPAVEAFGSETLSSFG